MLGCRDLIWLSASELLRRGVDVILDDGFFLREHRIRHIALAGALGASAKIHYLDTLSRPFACGSKRGTRCCHLLTFK